MINSSVIEQVLSIKDDRSGDHAQDGFDFQASTAIYLMFIELEQGNEFSLVYEKIDDFIMFVDNIRIYQSKSTSKTLTDSILFKKDELKKAKKRKTAVGTSSKTPEKIAKTPKPEVGLSIIEKIQTNIESIKKKAPGIEIKAHLLWNKDFNFGASLLKGTKLENDISNLPMSNLSLVVQQRIIQKTGRSNYDWNSIEIVRFLSKQHHERLTCKYIEDVIYNIIGPNLSYSKSFYDSLSNKIRISRTSKKAISSSFLVAEIKALKAIPTKPKPTDYQHLLNDEDYKNQLIHNHVKEIFLIKSIDNNPIQKAFIQVAEYVNQNYFNIKNPCYLYDKLKELHEFKEVLLLNSEEKVKALIINAYLDKERE